MSNSRTSSLKIPVNEPRRWFPACSLLLLMSWPAEARLIQTVSPEASDAPQTVEQVIGAYVSALGGKEALAQITTRKAEGRVEVVNRKEGGQRFIAYWRAPDFSRMRVESAGEEIELGFDGKSGWRSEYVGVIERVSGRSLELLLRDANPLRYVRLAELYPDVTLDREPPEDAPKGTGLVYRGPEETLRFYFDPQSHLLAEIVAEGAKDETGPRHYLFEDYRKVDGVLFPFAIREIIPLPNADPRAVHIEHIVRFHKVQNNISIPDSMFSPHQ
jgi:hypothetical protein